MKPTVISVENLSKQYQLGLISGRTLSEDVTRWLARLRTRPDPLLKVGQEDLANREGQHIWALRDVSFEVRQGEVLGIIGRNGAGKSTLLKILSRVTAPTSGQVKIKGRIASLLEVGTGFHPELTGRENIYLNGAILGMQRQEIARKFDEIVAFAEIEKFVETPVKRYSSGMYVRLAFAVAAHLEPEILLIDEVLAVGDVAFQQKCLGKMGAVAEEGRTVLFVSHNMSTVQHLCGRVLLFSKGHVTNMGDPNALIQEYVASTNVSHHGWNLSNESGVPQTGFRFVDLRFLDGAGQERNAFSPEEDVCIRITLECRYAFEDVVLGVTIRTVFGQPVFNLRSEDRGIYFHFSPGIHAVSVQFRLPNFLTNTFLVDLGSIRRSADVLQIMNSAGQFTTIAGDVSGFGNTRQRGEILYLQSIWQHHISDNIQLEQQVLRES